MKVSAFIYLLFSYWILIAQKEKNCGENRAILISGEIELQKVCWVEQQTIAKWTGSIQILLDVTFVETTLPFFSLSSEV